ncbi:MAG: YggS family pyridoxal phosphate-dependent enzyme [Acidimicrobiales bacterium]
MVERGTPGSVDSEQLRERLESVRARIAAAGGRDVEVVAVTKALGVDAAMAARDAGLVEIGENYADELVEKAEALAASPGEPVRWHLIGGIQRRTLARLAPFVALYQSVDRSAEAEAIARHAPGAAALIEVETTGLEGRGGVPPEEVARLVDAATIAGLEVKGLMTVGPPDDEAAQHRSFATVRALVDSLGLAVASMGMSDDFEIAVEEGSTMVRLGRVLFGPRPTRMAVSQ